MNGNGGEDTGGELSGADELWRGEVVHRVAEQCMAAWFGSLHLGAARQPELLQDMARCAVAAGEALYSELRAWKAARLAGR